MRFIVFFLIFSLSIVYFMFTMVDPVFAQESMSGFKFLKSPKFLTFFIRLLFVGACIAALFYGLWGVYTYITSGGEQEKIEMGQHMIVVAVVGAVLVVVVVAIIINLEKSVFRQRVCFGLSCQLTIPGIVQECYPNPQYRRDLVLADIAGNEVPISEECCPLPPVHDLRATVGWKAGTDHFGSLRHRICCVNGDRDGDMVCD